MPAKSRSRSSNTAAWVPRLGPQLAGLRAAQGINQAMFAERCEISAPYLSQIENGKRLPPPPLLKRILNELRVSSTEAEELRDLARRDLDAVRAQRGMAHDSRQEHVPEVDDRTAGMRRAGSALDAGSIMPCCSDWRLHSTLHLLACAGYPLDGGELVAEVQPLGILLPLWSASDLSLLCIASHHVLGRETERLWVVEVAPGRRLFAYRAQIEVQPDDARWHVLWNELADCGYPLIRVHSCSIPIVPISAARDTNLHCELWARTAPRLSNLNGAPLLDEQGHVVARWSENEVELLSEQPLRRLVSVVGNAASEQLFDPRRAPLARLRAYHDTADAYLDRWGGNGGVLVLQGDGLVLRYVLRDADAFAGITLVYPSGVDVTKYRRLVVEYAGGPERPAVFELKVKDATGMENRVAQLDGTGGLERWNVIRIEFEDPVFTGLDARYLAGLSVATSHRRLRVGEVKLSLRRLTFE